MILLQYIEIFFITVYWYYYSIQYYSILILKFILHLLKIKAEWFLKKFYFTVDDSDFRIFKAFTILGCIPYKE